MAWRDAKQAGARALVSAATIKRAALRGELRGFKISGRLWRFQDADIDAWIESQRAPAPYIVPTTTKGVAVTQVSLESGGDRKPATAPEERTRHRDGRAHAHSNNKSRT
jgi:excisionase family DNA binding protein